MNETSIIASSQLQDNRYIVRELAKTLEVDFWKSERNFSKMIKAQWRAVGLSNRRTINGVDTLTETVGNE